MYTTREYKNLAEETYFYLEFNDEYIDGLDDKGRNLEDGIYDLNGVEYIGAHGETSILAFKTRVERDKFIAFIEKYPDFYVANAYQTNYTVLLATKPKKVKSKNIKGDGFNYGSTNVITNCPSTILILAEND